MSAHDTPEVGSGETVGERITAGRIKHGVGSSEDFPGNVSHLVSPIVGWMRLRERDGKPFDDLRHTIDRLSLVLDMARQEAERNLNSTDPATASPDPVQPADAGDGLSEGERDAISAALRAPQAIAPDADMVYAAVDRILAAHEAAWAEKYAAVVGERDEWEVATRLREQLDAAMLRNVKHLARAESAEAALATALREKAEDRALRGRVEGLADLLGVQYETARENGSPLGFGWVISALGDACNELRAALAIPTATGDE